MPGCGFRNDVRGAPWVRRRRGRVPPRRSGIRACAPNTVYRRVQCECGRLGGEPLVGADPAGEVASDPACRMVVDRP